MESEDELRRWISDYSARLVRIALIYSTNLAVAEDCVQDAFIKAYRSAHQLSQRNNPFPWLVRIVINECKARQRKSWRERLTSQLPDAPVSSTEDQYIVQSEFRQIQQAIQSLPEKYKVPVILYYFEELPISEIADATQTNENTVKTRLSRARERLSRILREEEGWDHELGRQIVES